MGFCQEDVATTIRFFHYSVNHKRPGFFRIGEPSCALVLGKLVLQFGNSAGART